MMTNPTLYISEVHRRPKLVIESAPDRIVVVDGNGVVDSHRIDCPLYIIDIRLKWKFWRMHADYYKAVFPVFLRPCAHVWERSSPVDAGIGPKIDEDNPSTQCVAFECCRIEPCRPASQRREIAFKR